MSEQNDPALAQSEGGFDRRSFIRRSAVVSAATVWAVPTVQSVMTPAFAVGTPAGGCTACLTGGGEILGGTLNGVALRSITFGLTGGGRICCDSPQDGLQLQVNGHRVGSRPNGDSDLNFHFTQLLSLVCTKTGSPAPPPDTEECANRFTGTARDESGNLLSFVFEDNGEGANPNNGGMLDFVQLTVTIANGGGTMTATGTLDNGNLQVHEGFGPAFTRDCTGC